MAPKWDRSSIGAKWRHPWVAFFGPLLGAHESSFETFQAVLRGLLMRLTLASSSPRRRELLAMLLSDFDVCSPDIDETPMSGEAPEHYVSRLAMEKARRVVGASAIRLGADTTIVHAGQILGKPIDTEDARGLLARLSGDSHAVLTAVSVVHGAIAQVRLTSTRVTFAELSLDTIDAYLQTDEPWDKAGGYAIQGYAGSFVERIEGSYSGVVGLPLCETRCLLEDMGLTEKHG